MELTFECPECRMIDHTADVASADRAVCRHCGTSRGLPAEAFDAEGGLRACPMCGGADLYARKDFSTAVGLAVVITGIVVAMVFWYHEKPVPAYLVLGASVLLDLVLYRRVPEVVVCYRCLAQVRGPGNNPGGRFRIFDYGAGERHRRERPEDVAPSGLGVPTVPAEPAVEAGAGST